jgi:hypothetical protein
VTEPAKITDAGGKCEWCGKSWAHNIPATAGCPFCQAVEWKNGPDKLMGLTNDYVVTDIGWLNGKVYLDLAWPLNSAAPAHHVPMEEFLLRQIREAAGKMGLRVNEIAGMGIRIVRNNDGAIELSYLGRNQYLARWGPPPK